MWERCQNCGHYADAHGDPSVETRAERPPCEHDEEGETCNCPGYKGRDSSGVMHDDTGRWD